MRALLDVNVLIALLDQAHVHHAPATRWLAANIASGWASCAMTQLGCIRVMSQPVYPTPRPVAQIAARLANATRQEHHAFWAANSDPLDGIAIDWNAVLSPRHVTNVYLLALACAKDGRFVTFDRHVPLAAVPGATPARLVVLE